MPNYIASRPAPRIVTRASPVHTSVTVSDLDDGMLAALDHQLRHGPPLHQILQVSVVNSATAGRLPTVSGQYCIQDRTLQFRPHLPFEPGTLYYCLFDPPADPVFAGCSRTASQFRLPATPPSPTPHVTAIYPSSPDLPENVLRFYIVFSQPMQRGHALDNVTLLGPEGQALTDVLYRAPVELWSTDMRCLTVLLDPGRIKRGLGPHRELGPPLHAGSRYKLHIGAGMLGHSRQPLHNSVSKTFTATHPRRQPVNPQDWCLYTPAADTHDVLVVETTHPLDWAMLASSLSVETFRGQRIPGRFAVGPNQTMWTFAPETRWPVGEFIIVVSTALEDICGNDLLGPFDRNLNPEVLDGGPKDHSRLRFHIA